MMNKSGDLLRFVTSNTEKVREADNILPRPLVPVQMDLDEIQSTDMESLVRHKANQAFQRVRLPLFVEDTSLIFLAWNNLPGPYIKPFMDNLGLEGMVNALAPFEDWRAVAVCAIGYHNGEQVRYFEGRITGRIVPPMGTQGFGWDPIFQPDKAQRSFGEMQPQEKEAFSMRTLALKKLARHLEMQTP